MVKRNRPFFTVGIAILAVLIGISWLYIGADKSKMNLTHFSVDLSFAAAMSTLSAIALALIAIGYSIREADIHLFLGDKNVTTAGVLQEIRICNKGNALGNIAHSFIEIEVPQSSSISFAGAEGLDFQPTQYKPRKQYRLDRPQNPADLYPAKYIWSLLGFIQVPLQFKGRISFSVQVVGAQGSTSKAFSINV
jgi:hypothetical protein